LKLPDSPLATSLQGKAVERELVQVEAVDIRSFATDKHHTTDDVPYGGGAGMVMKCEPIVAALEHAREVMPDAPRIYMSPSGERLTQALVKELAQLPGMILLCGRYEGVDERVREGWIDREISIGDYVLTGGEPAALVVMDAVIRYVPGVLGNQESLSEESFSTPRLEYPHYTRPRSFRGMEVPEVLLSGHHGRIAQWRKAQAERITRERRPDLLGEQEGARSGEDEAQKKP
jgi:tRNA (guanine37-N1)-methyltransferase